MISVRNISKIYKMGQSEVRAADGISLDITDGEFVSVVGKSGSGKSTLLHVIGGIDKADGGSVFYGDTDILTLTPSKLTKFRLEHIGFVFQSFHLIPELTLLENVTLPARLRGSAPDGEYLDRILGTLGLNERLDHFPGQLSGGQQQRAALARAVINRPDVLLCDEPTGNLDSASGQTVRELILKLHKEFAMTVVVVTHDPAFSEISDRTVTIRDGKIVAI